MAVLAFTVQAAEPKETKPIKAAQIKSVIIVEYGQTRCC